MYKPCNHFPENLALKHSSTIFFLLALFNTSLSSLTPKLKSKNWICMK